MSNQPITITDETFTTAVLAADKPVVVDFWAEWCPPCHTVSLWMDKLAETFAGQLLVTKVNADENPETIAACGVLGLPTILFVRDGEITYRQVDEIDEAGLRALVDDFLAQA
jgi:thioredoxin 1